MKNIIDSKYIKTFNPCTEGIEDFESKHPNFRGSLIDLLSLEDISYSNKIWLATKIVNLKTLQQWSVECAEFVLDNFEKEYPYDTRVRDCIEVTKKVITGELPSLAAWAAARSAARSAESASNISARAARAAARSAAWVAARSASNISAWAEARSAARAAARSAAWAAARSAAWSAEKEQENINLSILIALIDNNEEV